MMAESYRVPFLIDFDYNSVLRERQFSELYNFVLCNFICYTVKLSQQMGLFFSRGMKTNSLDRNVLIFIFLLKKKDCRDAPLL